MPDAKKYWRLLWQLPYYNGAVSATFELLKAQAREQLEVEPSPAIEVPLEQSPRVVVPSANRRDRDDAPEAMTTMERAAREKGEDIKVVSPYTVNSLVGGEMISFGKG